MIKLFRRFLALIRNTFVAECPKCYGHFYGFHSYKQHVTIMGKNYRFVCHKCAGEHNLLK